MSATVFTIAQQKGGAGKTTLAAHLATAWQQTGLSVALVDIDPQRSLATWHAFRAELMGEEHAAPSVLAITGWRTAAQVTRLAEEHDIVLIDSPPHAETEARIAVRAANLVLVPVQPSPMDVWATKPTLDLAAKEGATTLVVFNRVPARANLNAAMAAVVKTDLGATMAKTTVGNRVGFAASMNEGRTLNETARRAPGALEIEALAKEVLRKAR